MKKIILLITATLFATGAFAQLNIDWGVKGGLSVSTLTKTALDSRVNFHAGIFAEFEVMSDFLSIQPEIIYSREGGRLDSRNWQRLDYIHIPVIVKIYILDRLSVDIGPQFGFLVNAKLNIRDDFSAILGGRNRSSFKTFNMAIGLGLSFKITRKFDVSARYNLGLTNFPKGALVSKNNVFQLGVGYRF